jgi:hypothetical protein
MLVGKESLSSVTTLLTSDLLYITKSTMISKSTFILNPKFHRVFGHNFSNSCFKFATVLLRAMPTLHCNIFLVAYKLFFRRTNFITCAQSCSFILPAKRDCMAWRYLPKFRYNLHLSSFLLVLMKL